MAKEWIYQKEKNIKDFILENIDEFDAVTFEVVTKQGDEFNVVGFWEIAVVEVMGDCIYNTKTETRVYLDKENTVESVDAGIIKKWRIKQ